MEQCVQNMSLEPNKSPLKLTLRMKKNQNEEENPDYEVLRMEGVEDWPSSTRPRRQRKRGISNSSNSNIGQVNSSRSIINQSEVL